VYVVPAGQRAGRLCLAPPCQRLIRGVPVAVALPRAGSGTVSGDEEAPGAPDLSAVGIAELSHDPLDDPVVQTPLVGELAECRLIDDFEFTEADFPRVLDQFFDVGIASIVSFATT